MTTFEKRQNEEVTFEQAANDFMADMWKVIQNDVFRLKAAKHADLVGIWDNNLSGEDKIKIYMAYYVKQRRQSVEINNDLLEYFR